MHVIEHLDPPHWILRIARLFREHTATADLAGLEIGESVEREGIAMGRESLILRAAAPTVAWRPAEGARRGWRPLVVVGVVWKPSTT